MTYVVLARKWRPQSFDDLVGQEHVSRTLAGAISGGRVAHAFLFTGVRGVGKTTSARILAKALNCEKGPTASPCLKCPPCLAIAQSTDVDVREIDGASYTGVDEVRRLQESLPYQPARDRFKIFIVDEVHMLSTNAWNAFLKTLEEPPPHVKFIFATTEASKVPVTILSRCQRYDFKLIGMHDLIARLRYVLEQEHVAADDEALRIIAREAAGSMRDAMSMLDQVMAWGGGGNDVLTADGVARVLGVAAHGVLHELGQSLVEGKAQRCLEIIAELAEQGFGMNVVARDLLAYLRDLVVANVSESPERLLDLADAERADLVALARRSDQADLSRLFLGLSRAFDDIGRSVQPRAAFEMALVRLAQRPPLLPLDELLRRLADLERRLAASPAGGAAGARGRGGGSPAQGGPVRSAAGAPARGADVEATSSAASPSQGPREVRATSEHQSSGASAEAGGPPPVAPGAHAVEDAAAATKLDDPAVLAAWRETLATLARRHPGLSSVYQHAVLLELGPKRLVLGFAQRDFIAEQASDPKAQRALAEAAGEHFGEVPAVELQLDEQHSAGWTVASMDSAARAARDESARQRVRQHPLVVATMEALGAELRDIHLREA